MLIGIESCERLQDRRCHLENQRDDAYLCKREVELILHNRIDGRDNRLNHIVQEMGNATDVHFFYFLSFLFSYLKINIMLFLFCFNL